MKLKLLAVISATLLVTGVVCCSNQGEIIPEAGLAASTTPPTPVPTASATATTTTDAGTDAAPPVAQRSCTNGARDGDESDVDCGGALCSPCPNEASCNEGPDCVSRVCTKGRCSVREGCSDGTREGFKTTEKIAACAGGFDSPGLMSPSRCANMAGNDSPNSAGKNCSAADLCQISWHVCKTLEELKERAPQGCGDLMAPAMTFFATALSGPGGAQCGEGSNDLFGCGTLGNPTDSVTCTMLDKTSGDICAALGAPWNCGTVASSNELAEVTKPGSEGGGVLCCKD